MKADRFLNEFRQALRESFFLKLVLLIVVLVVIGQFLIITTLLKNQKIILVPTAKFAKEVVLKENEANYDYYQILIRDFLRLYTTYTSQDIESRLREALAYVSPQTYHIAEKLFVKRAKQIKEVGVSQYSEIRRIEFLNQHNALAEIFYKKYISGELVEEGRKYYWIKFHMENGRFYIDFVKPVKSSEIPNLKQKFQGGGGENV